MSYLPHQIEKSDDLYKVLAGRKLAMLWGSPRSGKTRTAIRVAEISKANRILVITKKAAISGIQKELEAVSATKHYTVTNYEQCKKLKADDFDFCIVDESHNLNKVGKMSQRFKDVRAITFNKPCLLLSGTPAVEALTAIYYQLAISRYSPFSHFKSFYEFFRAYGIPSPMWIAGRSIEQYKKAKDTLAPALEPYVVRMTQEDAGISCHAQDKLHIVHLSEATKELIDKAKTNGVLHINGEIVALESDMAARSAIHQIESGALLIEEELVELDNTEVVDYLRANFSGNVALMAHYRSTRQKLARYLPDWDIYSSDGNAEGVDLSHYDHFVIVNSGFSGAKFIQRRERVVNINRETEAIVHHIVTDAGISADVYDAVSNKRDYNLRMFRNDRARNTKEDFELVG